MSKAFRLCPMPASPGGSSCARPFRARSWRRAKELGCGGFVTKNESPSEFLDAVRAVVAGRSHFPHLQEDIDPVAISSREIEIRDALLEGKAPFQIAQGLGISYGSVQTYKKRLFKKLGVTSMLDFLRQAVGSP